MSTNAALEPSSTTVSHKDMANAIAALSMDAVQRANSGHPGMPMGTADIATVLFSKFLKFDPKHPNWPDRDRFILSAGHGSMLLYSLLYLTGYEDMTLEDIKQFRQLGAKTCGHPEYGEAAGIETTTGPLGQGIANGVGMALAEQLLHARMGKDIVDHYTYVLAGDGCLMEGISHEAISLAGTLQLGKLIVLFDDNHICIDGPTELTVNDDQPARFKASGWHVQAIDGHNPEAIEKAIEVAKNSPQPSLIACRTTIAKGSPTKAGTATSHGAPLGEEEINGTREALGWKHEPFVIPDDVLDAWRSVGQQGAEQHQAWKKRFDQHEEGCTDTECVDPFETERQHMLEYERMLAGELPEKFNDTILELKHEFSKADAMATRKSSGKVLAKITDVVPEMIGGSADLTGSNLTKNDLEPINKDDFSGRYIYYGVREHAMCAAMNGMALHGGIIPYGGTFFVFTDYCRPAIRLAALMKQRVIYVMTHDSIGLGEDGPTHQPVEHLSSLRAMPNLYVYRPADATEVAECWQLSLERRDAPSMLVLTRQNVPNIRPEFTEENRCAKGGYVLSECHPDPALVAGEGSQAGDSSPSAQNDRIVTLIATGSEVELAMEAQEQLARQKIAARVVSLPCWELFDQQPESYQQEVLGDGLRVAIEAGAKLGWEKYIGRDGIFIGMESFGASAPANDLFNHFGITARHVIDAVKGAL